MRNNDKADWRDGFLFLGNHLALNFLNTRPLINGVPAELLADWEAVARWAAAARLIGTSSVAAIAQQPRDDAEADRALCDLQTFREELRAVITAVENKASLPEGFVEHVNQLSHRYPLYSLLESGPDLQYSYTRSYTFDWTEPGSLFAPVADAVSRLLVDEDLTRVRKCQSPTCVLHFLDTSKNRTRNWCSMQMCGNRAKVGAYARRQRGSVAMAG